LYITLKVSVWHYHAVVGLNAAFPIVNCDLEMIALEYCCGGLLFWFVFFFERNRYNTPGDIWL